MEKRQIDIKRDSGGQTIIGSEADGAVTDLFEFDGKLLAVKTKAIYELILADKVDPQRENFNLPTDIQRCVLNFGSESELVSRILLMSKILLTGILPTIDHNRALILIFDGLLELVALQNEILEYCKKETEVVQEYEGFDVTQTPLFSR